MRKRVPRVLWIALLAAPLVGETPTASATELIEAWRAATRNDKEYAVARAAHAAAQPRRDQAAALWRPTVGLVGAAGIATNESDTRGAQFGAPGFGQSSDVAFSTSVTNGTATRWAIAASQPLIDPKRRAEQKQLATSVDLAELQWQAAGQSLMLRTAERYLALALAEEALRVHRLQLDAVRQAALEAQDRFELGDAPITDTHEAGARLAGLRAQVLAAEADLQVRRNLLADTTGLAPGTLEAQLPAGSADDAVLEPLESWLDAAQSGNPGIRTRLVAAEVARYEAAKYGRASSATVELVAQLGRDRLSGSGDFGSASHTGTNRMLGVQISMPLFTGGLRSAREDEALLLVDKASAEVEHTRELVAQQVRQAWLGLSVGAERVRALEHRLTASQARRDATRLGHEVGERTTLNLLDAENESAAARLALAEARVGLLMNRLRLAALVGRLDETALLAARAKAAGGNIN